MDYRLFLEQGQSSWVQLEELFRSVRRSGLEKLTHDELEGLAASHRRAVSDFAYARTHFPGSSAERRLRQLAFEGHRHLAARREPAVPRLKRFLRLDVPLAFRNSSGAIAVAVAIFLGAALLGAVLTTVNESVADVLVGREGVEGLRDGKIWTDEVGKVMPGSVLSSRIFTNNITVALLCWLGGALLGVGTLWLLVFNGLHIGAVFTIVWQYGLFDRLLAWVSAHGPLELFLIVVASAAGLELARGEIQATHEPRAVVMARHAKRSAHLALGVAPWLVLLGFVEGFVSPQMDLATSFKALIGIALLGAFLAYALRPLPTEYR